MRTVPVLLIVAILSAGCARKKADVYTYVPEGTNMLLGANLDRVRQSALTAQFPALRSLVERFKDGRYLITAFRGTEVLEIERAPFTAAPAGMRLVDPDVALQGSPAIVQSAETQHASGKPGNEALAKHASTADVWLAIQRGTQLPLPGNLANLNRFLARADYTTLELTLSLPVDATLTMYAGTSREAIPLEQELRAALTLASAGDKENAALWSSARIKRDDRHVRAQLSIPLAVLQRLYSFSSQGK